MKLKQVNRNFIWAETFVNQLYSAGIRHVCISPGSRSTPLTIAFSKQKKIKSFVHIDERVSGFFALGLAKKSGLPTVIVTTSGTATTELYPAITEAFMQRVPLIICTADRPPELLNRGANQTINQWNLYRNHIRFFKNIGLPQLSVNALNNLKKITLKAFDISVVKDRGPVHLNFPFRKPLEPDSFTDEIEQEVVDCIYDSNLLTIREKKTEIISKSISKQIDKLADKISKIENGLIIAGPLESDIGANPEVVKLARISRYPIIADGLSQLRNYKSNKVQTVCRNYDSYLRSNVFKNNYKPEIILQFGRTVTSLVLQNYIADSGAEIFLINKYGDVFDPSGKSKSPLKSDAKIYCSELTKKLLENDFKRGNTLWSESFRLAEEFTGRIKTDFLENSNLNFEPKAIQDCISALPHGTRVMIGNSSPVRDLDNFVQNYPANLKLYFNRGASGIDGITSTALGISVKGKPLVLITGDLSFLHDLNALMPAVKYSIPMVVVSINNNGGGIFNMLPVSRDRRSFEQFFKTPHNLNIAGIVKSFGLQHVIIKDENNLKTKLAFAIKQKSLTVLEIKTDAEMSSKLRQNYWAKIVKLIDKEFTVV
ncbi:2-succinyl-5-enolpyruvyl-6-hydroxy-3-cyclohexene-1-carboxylic-acid synthase [Bacteroidota bacterium]